MGKSIVDIVETKNVKCIPCDIKDVKIDGFWKYVIERNRKVSIPLLYKLLLRIKQLEILR